MTKLNIRFSFLSLIIITLYSCSPLKYWDNAVFKHYGEFPALKPTPPNTPILVNLPLSAKDTSKAFATVYPEVKKNLFLLLYWKRHAAFNIVLHDKIPLHQFSNSLYQYAKSSRITEKLNGKKLIIDVEKWPNSFSMNNIETVYLWLVITNKIFIDANLQNVVVSYKLEEAGAIIKQGKVEISDPMKGLGLGVFQSASAAADEYLSEYDNFYKGLGKQVIDKILADR